MSQGRIMIVEDDDSLREAICDSLELADYNCASVNNAKSALGLINEYVPNILVSDVNMDEMDGFALLKAAKKLFPHLPVLMITAYGNVAGAVKAMREGASDYIQKPFEPHVLVSKINLYVQKSGVSDNQPVAKDPQSQQLLALAAKVAESHVTVLLTGESGTGKEVLARFIHDQSLFREGPFIAINCAAIPENMLEAILFGYEKGAFTGAQRSMPGKFEQAQNGTLLLDEISEMSLGLQAKLLRVLQERELERLGSQKTISLNVRVIATSNKNLQEQVENGTFREDLFYRLNVFPLKWAPLVERPLDIIPLAEYLIKRHTSKLGLSAVTLTEKACRKLCEYHWPGNARELDNVVQRSLVLHRGEVIDVEDIHIDYDMSRSNEITNNKRESISNSNADNQADEHKLILNALNNHKISRKDLAKQLGISPRTLRYKLAKMRNSGIKVPLV